ncbi:MAG: class I SAM-dependent methyltransferase [Planctomycetota bacterium]|nr:class I SAM-dependent methyltransferase [Planctomycetota bacterium]
MNNALHDAALAKIESAYDSPPWWYDIRGFFILTFSYRSTLMQQVRFFGRNISEHHLEAAIGTGTLLDLILRWRRWKGLPTAKIVGFDYAEPMLAGARKRFAHCKDIRLEREDATRLAYADESFSSANITNAVHCFPQVDLALSELHRVLKPGATAAMNVLLYARGPWPLRQISDRIAAWGMRKGILETPYEQADIEARVRNAGFDIVEARVSGNALMLLARKPVR